MVHLDRKFGLVGILAVSALFSVSSASALYAQNPPARPGSDPENNAPCYANNVAESATKPETHAASGTSPGNTGSTGWTGGTGGAYTETSPQGALPESRTWQPPTARGVDLAMAPPKASGAKSCGSPS